MEEQLVAQVFLIVSGPFPKHLPYLICYQVYQDTL